MKEIRVLVRGMRGAILGEWGQGFNQENGDSVKKIGINILDSVDRFG